MSTARLILQGLGNVAVVIIVAPFFEGVLRKVTARIQSRQGPPIWQPYYDLLKLLGKEDIEVGESPLIQRLSAYFSFAGILTVATLVPMGGPSPLGECADLTLLVYLLALCGISTLLAGLSAGTVYSVVGMSREMMSMMTLEPVLAVALVIGALRVGSLRLDAVLDGSVYAGATFPLAGIVALCVTLLALQAFVGRLPFDTTEAETEIMEGPMIEYSGPKLALFKFAHMSRTFVYGSLFIGLFAPWGSDWVYPLSLLALLIKLFVLVLIVTVVAATHARYRIDQVIRYYAVLFSVSMGALVLAVCGW